MERALPPAAMGLPDCGCGPRLPAAADQSAHHHHRAGQQLRPRLLRHGTLRADRRRTERGGGLRGPAGPRLCGLLRRRFLLRGDADEPGLAVPAHPVLVDHPDCHGGDHVLRRGAGRSDAPAARRLSGHRDPRLRGDCPDPCHDHPGHERSGGIPECWPPARNGSGRHSHLLQFQRRALVLADADHHHHHHCCWSATSSAAGSAGPGSPSGRTKTPPRSWACPPSSTRSGRSPSGQPSAVSPAPCSPARWAS